MGGAGRALPGVGERAAVGRAAGVAELRASRGRRARAAARAGAAHRTPARAAPRLRRAAAPGNQAVHLLLNAILKQIAPITNHDEIIWCVNEYCSEKKVNT